MTTRMVMQRHARGCATPGNSKSRRFWCAPSSLTRFRDSSGGLPCAHWA